MGNEEKIQEDDKGADASFSLEALLETLPPATASRLQRELRQREETIQEQKEAIERLDGTAFADLSSICTGKHEMLDSSDYQQVVRNWDENQFTVDELREVYATNRSEALVADNLVSMSPSLMSSSHSAVRLTGKVTKRIAQKAHLCPKTGVTMKCDTWLYAVAAVLGMPSETEQDRKSLYRAIRGSKASPDNDESKRAEPTKSKTGINRSPFNLLGFASQKEWFDERAGLLILPIMSLDDAKAWDGSPYSVLAVCNTLGASIGQDVSPDEIASNVFLNRTPVSRADSIDVQVALLLLKQMVKASAVCVAEKHGPDNKRAKKLWESYTKSLRTVQSTLRCTLGLSVEESAMSVLVPEPNPQLPDGKIVAKIDLAHTSTVTKDLQPAYPDPMLLAFKSSVNWTQANDFQLMAEAEVLEDDSNDFSSYEIGIKQGSNSWMSFSDMDSAV